jgi:hypothetical protein
MQMKDTIFRDWNSAVEYDQQARDTHWFSPAVILGLNHKFVKSGDLVLNLGMGSGELTCCDLGILSLPYPSSDFTHMLSVAILNSVQDLSDLSIKMARTIMEHWALVVIERRQLCMFSISFLTLLS